MSKDFRLSKVEILCQQKKYSEAEEILKDLLAQDSNNTTFLSLLAEVNLQQSKFDVARDIIENAIGLAPDTPHLFYIKARIAIQQEAYDEAETNLNHCIQLDPGDADYFALLANIRLARKDYEEALTLADKSLELDAENLLGLNTRSAALLKLNRKTESFETIEGALREDPNNAYTHANYGWGLLEKGDYKKAMEHFKEALQNDPNNKYAQSGLLQAIKATNPIYRLYLKYAFFIGKLSAKYQWGVVIGFYLGVRGLQYMANTYEAIQPYLNPLIVALGIIAFSTWVIKPISNLFLRFNKYGQLLLTKAEKISSNFVAVSFVVFIAGALLYFIKQEDKFLPIAFFGFSMMLPLGIVFSPAKHKIWLLIYTVVLAVAGLLAISVSLVFDVLFSLFSDIYLYGFIGFQFLTNFFLIKEDNH